MTDNYIMKYTLLTLVDITQTNARRGEDALLQRQQQNFFSVMQTISLRSNPDVHAKPNFEKRSIAGLGFGSAFKGEQMVWKLDFEFEQDSSHTLELLMMDFDMVPFIHNLSETVKFKDHAFVTNSKQYTNVIFKEQELDAEE